MDLLYINSLHRPSRSGRQRILDAIEREPAPADGVAGSPRHQGRAKGRRISSCRVGMVTPLLSLTALLEPAWMLEGVNEDLSWFTKALLSHPESFLRAVGAPSIGERKSPTGLAPSSFHYRG